MFALVPILALFSPRQAAALPPMLQGVHRIVMLGDSITQMGGEPKGYVTIVKQTLNSTYPGSQIDVVNAGISGQKAPDMHARFMKDVLDRHPEIVTISVGVNDVWHDFRTPEWTARVATGDSGRGVKLPSYLSELEAMVTEAQATGAKVIVLSPTLIYEDLDCAENKRLSEYIQAGKQLAERHHATYVDLNHAFREAVARYQQFSGKRTLLLTIDGVHMNDAGNALMADMLLKTLGVPTPNNVSP